MSIGSGTLFPHSRSKDTTNKLNSHQDRRFTNRCRSVLKSTEATNDHAKKLSSEVRRPVLELIELRRGTWTKDCILHASRTSCLRERCGVRLWEHSCTQQACNQRRIRTGCPSHDHAGVYTCMLFNRPQFCRIHRVFEAWSSVKLRW